MEHGGRRLSRHPAVWAALFLLVLVCGIGIGLWLGLGVSVERSLMSKRCDKLQTVDLSIPEIVDLKDRWKAYARDESAQAFMRLTTREASWLLSAELGAGVWLEGTDDQLVAHLTAPVKGGCYNVRYRGTVQVMDGTAILESESLVVGGVDISEIAGGGMISNRRVVTPADLQDEVWAEKLRGLQMLRVNDGDLQLRFEDPSTVWR